MRFFKKKNLHTIVIVFIRFVSWNSTTVLMVIVKDAKEDPAGCFHVGVETDPAHSQVVNAIINCTLQSAMVGHGAMGN